MTQDIALKRSMSDMLAEYEAKKNCLDEEIERFEKAGSRIKNSCTINGTYGQERIDVGNVYKANLQVNLLRSAWLSFYKTARLDVLLSARDQKIFEQSLSDLPEFTRENLIATFGNYIANPYDNILRGLAEVFSDLDPYYKSHEKMKIGVSGLPKRIIIRGFNSYSSYGWERLKDVVNALASYKGDAIVSHGDLMRSYDQNGEYFIIDRGMRLRTFNNGNGHLFFEPKTLKDINRALAEYYGEVLADCHEAKEEQRQQSTEVSKDLQYYPTPDQVVDVVLSDVYLQDGDLILEPSCGCGRIIDGIKRVKGAAVTVHGIEFDPHRADIAIDKGYKVQVANFLETVPTPKYDRVIMNPPFYGKHYAKHVNHAFKFLKAGGVLTSILPISARYDHGLLEGAWRDLPVGSFSESGTNINTTVLTMRKAEA